MTKTERASLEFQAPDPALQRRPDSLPVYRVCPHCKKETRRVLATDEGRPFDRCYAHGDVVAIPSHVRNEAS